jgi:hypothetical protein
MLAAIERPDARLIARRWAERHRSARITLHEDDVHYLSAMALAADDDLVAYLLLAKLRMAERARNGNLAATVRMNSLVEFDAGGGEIQLARLTHPSVRTRSCEAVAITSLVGAGLIGLGTGQAIAWPDESGTMCPLKILRVVGHEAGGAISTNGKEIQ